MFFLSWSPSSSLDNNATNAITIANARNQWSLPRQRLQTSLASYDMLYEFYVPFWLVFAIIFLGAGGTLLILWHIGRLQFRREHGLCLFCGYNLRGAASPQCSECGHPINPVRRITKNNLTFFALILTYIVPAVFFLLVWIMGKMPVLGEPWTLERCIEIWLVQMMGITAFVLLMLLGHLGIVTAAFGCCVIWGVWFILMSHVPILRQKGYIFHFILCMLWCVAGLFPVIYAYPP